MFLRFQRLYFFSTSIKRLASQIAFLGQNDVILLSVGPFLGDDDVDLDGYSSQYLQEHDSGTQSESDDKSESEISENIEVSSLNIESEDEEVNDDKNKEEKVIEMITLSL